MVLWNGEEGQAFFIIKFFILQEVTIALQGSFGKIPLYFDMPSSYTMDNVGVKYVVMRTSRSEKMQVTVMLAPSDF